MGVVIVEISVVCTLVPTESTTSENYFSLFIAAFTFLSTLKKQHNPMNISFNLTSTFVAQKLWNYIANFPIVCIFTKQIFYIHRIPLQNISVIRTSITTIIRLPHNIQVRFFSQNSTILFIFIPTQHSLIINIRNEKKGGKNVETTTV